MLHANGLFHGNYHGARWEKWSLTIAEGSIPQTWYIDTTNNAIRIESYPASDAGTITVEEFVGDKKYTYFSPNVSKLSVDASEFCAGITDYDGDCATLAAELAGDVEAMSADWAGNKAECTFEDAWVSVSPVKTISNGNLVVAGFFALMVDGVPTSIVDAESDEVIATIDSIEDWSGDISVVGCSAEDDMSGDESRRLGFYDTIAEGRERRRNLGEDNEEAEKARNYLNSIYIDMAGKHDEAEDAQRRLGAWTSFQAWASGTRWCGAGTDIENTQCPVDSSDHGDMACHRHGHGKKANGIIGGMAAWFWNTFGDLTSEEKPQTCVVEAGEVLYVPGNFYHQTINLATYNSFLSVFAQVELQQDNV